MALGPDIKEVIEETGTPITIFRTPTNITGEFAKTKTNSQVTKPFIREFFLEALLPHDTSVVAGDWIQTADGRVFVVMNMTPTVFEGETYSNSVVLYKCNTTGKVKRQSITRVNYSPQVAWDDVVDPCYALVTESLYGNELDDDTRVGRVTLKSYDCYLPSSKGVKKGDRFWISADEYYVVENISSRRFDSVDLLTLGEDNRG